MNDGDGLTAYEIPDGTRDVTGVERRLPPVPNGHFRSRALIPSTWLNHAIEVTTTDGGSCRGTFIELCATGPIVLTRLSTTEAVKRIVAWEAIKYVDLVEKGA